MSHVVAAHFYMPPLSKCWHPHFGGRRVPRKLKKRFRASYARANPPPVSFRIKRATRPITTADLEGLS